MLKRIGTQARQSIEALTGRKVYLDLRVRLLANWRDDPNARRTLGFPPPRPQGAPSPADRLDRIYPHSSEAMAELPEASVHLMVTSPPYNAGKDYDEDLTLDEYRDLLRRVFRETRRVLVSGGRGWVGV